MECTLAPVWHSRSVPRRQGFMLNHGMRVAFVWLRDWTPLPSSLAGCIITGILPVLPWIDKKFRKNGVITFLEECSGRTFQGKVNQIIPHTSGNEIKIALRNAWIEINSQFLTAIAQYYCSLIFQCWTNTRMLDLNHYDRPVHTGSKG